MIASEAFNSNDGDGRLLTTLYSFLMMRVEFVRDVLLDNSVMAAKMTHVGHFEKAIGLLEQIEYVAAQPFADEIQLKITGFLKLDGSGPLPDDMQVSDKLEVREVARRWNSLSIRIIEAEGYKVKGNSVTEVAQLQGLYDARLQRVKSRITTRLAQLQ
jgi:hypothetical protein